LVDYFDPINRTKRKENTPLKIIHRQYCKWRKTGLLRRVLSTLTAGLKTRGGFDFAKVLSGGSIQFERKLGRRCKLALDQEQLGSWQHITALLLLSIAAR